MLTKRPLPSILFGLAGMAMTTGASALGWERMAQTAVLGAPLDFSVSLRLDPGDTPIEAKCVTAEAFAGETRLTTARVGVDTSSNEAVAVRVITPAGVNEPVVTISVAVGCPVRLSRRFTLLLDPPAVAAPAVLAEVPAEPARSPAPAPAAPAVAEVAPPPARAPQVTRAPSEHPARTPAPRPPRKVVAAAPRPAPDPKPRLRLEPTEPAAQAPALAASAVEEALQAVAQAASAARSAASAASAAETRVVTLEKQVTELRSEAEQNKLLMAQLRARAAEAEQAGRWMMPLLVLLALMAAAIVWMGLKLRQLQQGRQREWKAAAAQGTVVMRPQHASTVQLPTVDSEMTLPVAPTLPAMREPETTPPPVERTEVLPPRAVPEPPSSARDVSIEELLDLEQQAEFFIVLGQDEAAIDLLVDHLRDTGGGSPLPYLKLLEIYRRRNDRDAYERTRARFNHRFNAYAPEWSVDLQQGRSLEDYPGVIPRLQQVWGKPLDAMAELEALLFRKSRGQLFELPAYREVLFLYSLARDLLDRESAGSGDVDLLLPMADGTEFGATAPNPFLGLERESVFDTLPVDKPTAPVDLDLTQPDTLSAPITQPMAPRR